MIFLRYLLTIQKIYTVKVLTIGILGGIYQHY
jgi:hypothetical protein